MFFSTDPESESENKRDLRGAFSDTEDYLDHGLVSSVRCASRTSSIGSWSECLKPSFTQKLTFRSVLEGEPAVFRCKLVACPLPKVSWFHNNKPICKDSRRTIKTDSDMHIHNCSLLIKSVEDRDSGSYRIFAINSEGSAECTASLLVALREEQNPKYLDFVRYSEKTHESIDSLVQKRRESRLKVDLKCVGSPFDKRRETQILHSQYPKKGLVKTISFERLYSLDSCERRRVKRQDLGENVLDKEIQRKLNLLRELRKSKRGSRTLSQSSSDAYSDADLESLLSDTSSTTRLTLTERLNIGIPRSPETADMKENLSSRFHGETLGDHFINSSVPQKSSDEIKIFISESTDIVGRGDFSDDYLKMPTTEKKADLPLVIQRKPEYKVDWTDGRVFTKPDEVYERHQDRALNPSPGRSNIQVKLTETSLDSLSLCEGIKQHIAVPDSKAPVNVLSEIYTQDFEDQMTKERLHLDIKDKSNVGKLDDFNFNSKIIAKSPKAEHTEGEIYFKESSPINKSLSFNTQQKDSHLVGISPQIKEEKFSVSDEVYSVPHQIRMKEDDQKDETNFRILKESKVAQRDSFYNRPLKNINDPTEKGDVKIHIQKHGPIRSRFITDTPEISAYSAKHYEKDNEINLYQKASLSEKEATKKKYSKFQIQKEEIKYKEVTLESAKLFSYDEPTTTRNFKELCGSDLLVTSKPRIRKEESISEVDKVIFFDECMQKDIIEKENNAMQFDIQERTQLEGKDSSFRPSFYTKSDSLEKKVQLESAKLISHYEPTDTRNFKELHGSDLMVTSEPRMKIEESISEVDKVMFFDESMQKDIIEKENNAMQFDIQERTQLEGKDSSFRPSFYTISDSIEKKVQLESAKLISHYEPTDTRNFQELHRSDLMVTSEPRVEEDKSISEVEKVMFFDECIQKDIKEKENNIMQFDIQDQTQLEGKYSSFRPSFNTISDSLEKEVELKSSKLISYDEPTDTRNFQELWRSDVKVTPEPRMKIEESISEVDKVMFFDGSMQKDIIEKENNAMQFDIKDQTQLEGKDSFFRPSFKTISDSLGKEVELESAKLISYNEPTDTRNFQELWGSDLKVKYEPRVKEEESISKVDKVMFFDECMHKDIIEKENNAMQFDIKDQTQFEGKDSSLRPSFKTISDSLRQEVELESVKLISCDEPTNTRNFQELHGSDLTVTSEPRMKEEESIREVDKVMFFDECMQKDIIKKENNAMQFDIQKFEKEKDLSVRPSFNTIYDSLEKEVELELPTLKETEFSTITNIQMETKTKTDNYISEKSFRASSKPCTPMFTSDIDSQEVFEGERCSFICNFRGYPQPTVSWYNNDISIPRNEEYVITTTETSSTLTFICVRAHHQGSITCVIFNQYGTDTTFGQLKVKTKESENWDEAETLIKCEVLITKHLTESDEEELVSLLENNKERQKFDRDIDRFSLQVPQASCDKPCTLEDSSAFPVEIKITAPTPVPEYEEELKESVRNVESSTEPSSVDNIAQKMKHKFKFSFDVAVEAPKLIKGVKKQTKCKEGDCTLLECVISGDPDTLIAWYYNNVELKKSDKYNIQETNGTYKLSIKDVSKLDIGHYKCVATNRAGTIESESELIVDDAAEGYKTQQVEIAKDMKTDNKIMKMDITQAGNEPKDMESRFCQNTNIDIVEKVDNTQGFQPLSNVFQDDLKKHMPGIAQIDVETSLDLFKEESMSKVQHTSEIPAEPKVTGTESNNINYCSKMQETEFTEANKQLPTIPKRRHSFVKKQSTTVDEIKPPLKETAVETVAGERTELPVAPRRRRSVVKSKSETQLEIKTMTEGFIQITDKGQNLENKSEDTKKELPTVPKRRRSIVKAKSGIDTESTQNKEEIVNLVKSSSQFETSKTDTKLVEKIQLSKESAYGEQIHAASESADIGVKPGYGSETQSTGHLSDFQDAKSKFRALDKGTPVTKDISQTSSLETKVNLDDIGGKDLLDGKLKLQLNELTKKDVKQEAQVGRSESDIHKQEIALSVYNNENVLGYLEPPPEDIETEPRDFLTEYLVSAGKHEVLLPQEVKSPSENQKGQITELEVEDVTFNAYYDFYKTRSLIDRSLSPESEMSIEAACCSSDEVLDQDHFYTPLPSVEVQSPLSDSFVTPASSPERYFTPVEHTFYSNDGDGLKKYECDTTVAKSIDISYLSGSSKLEDYYVDNIRSHNPGGEANEMGMPPAFIKPLPKRCIYENTTLCFAVEVVGVPLPDIKWYRNLSLLANSDRIKISREGHFYIFEMHNVQISEGGEYSCVASNTLGEARTTTQVDILPHDGRSVALPPPVTHQHVMEFDMEPLHTSRSPSPQEILLEVELDESEVKDFEKQVKIITIPEFSPDNKSMVISLDVLPLVYDEQLSSIFTRDNEDVKVNFEVPEKPPYFVQPLRDLHVAEKSDAEFKCSVMGLPKPSVTWFKEYIKISPDTTKYLIKEDGTHQSLLIRGISMSDVGFYTCKAANHFGDVTCKAMLTVTDLDSVAEIEKVAQLPDISLEGATSMPCNYDLIVDNTALDPNQSEIQLEFEFEGNGNDANRALELVAISNNEREEDGKKCIDVNFDVFAKPSLEKDIQFKSKGSDSCCFEFQITESPPKFKKVLSDLAIQAGGTACFQCLVNGSPVPNVAWYKNDILLHGDRYNTKEKTPGCHQLEIGNVILSDEGQYKCVASNEGGTAETSAFLKVS
eukprot:XP_017952813.1 PREDICTED: titin [Xenopus tropicalis]